MKPVSKIDRYVIKKVRERREQLGYSQAALAYAIDVNQSYIAAIESDQYSKKYTLERLNEIARVLQCSLHDFLPKHPL
jgi:transcriptional regulator with XRE-family HTH domain